MQPDTGRPGPAPFPPPPPGGGGFRPAIVLYSFLFSAFVAGGFVFGWMFLANWNNLLRLRPADIIFPPGPIRSSDGRTEPAAPPTTGRNGPAAPSAAASQTPELPEWVGTNRVNILLLGIDHRDDEPIDGSRSDTMLVVSIDPATKAVVMISLPRDLYVSIPGYPSQRINSAHVYGGPSLAARTVEQNFGIPVQYYARIDFRGFEQIVDALGGVIVDVEQTIKDNEYPTEDYGIMRLFIPPGPQLMEGRLALQYARSRHGATDFARARRQQRLLLAMRERGLQLNILPKVPSLISLVQRAIQTDVGVTDMLKLARLGSEVERDRVKSVVVDVSLADPFIGLSGEDLLQPRKADIQRAIARAFAEANGEWARLEILNGTNRPGLARQLADRLAGSGYEVVRFDTADRADYRETAIVVLSGNQTAATTLAQRLRLPTTAIRVSPIPDSPADLRVIIGDNFQP